MMNKLFSIIRCTFLEQIRSRLYLVVLMFGAVVVVGAVLIGAMAPGYKVRVIFDLGLLSMEVFGLIVAVFGLVHFVSQDMESKNLYVLLTRPLPRPVFIMGRYIGIMLSVVGLMVLMSLLHVLVLMSDGKWFQDFSEGWSFFRTYPFLVMMSGAKIFVVSSLALFFSLWATSPASALVFTFCFWFLGHFGSEMLFMLNKVLVGWPEWILNGILFFVPNFQILNFRDMFMVPGFSLGGFLGWSILYGVGYCGFYLVLSFILFARKEF